MRFTFWAVGCPFLLIGVQIALRAPHGLPPFGLAIYGLTMMWFWIGFPLTTIYWLVRLVRYAWRDKPAPAAPIEDTGRVFGRLN